PSCNGQLEYFKYRMGAAGRSCQKEDCVVTIFWGVEIESRAYNFRTVTT
ncbi:hypothetical protein CEXT_462951, partial [Caerostris extrusa]